MISKVGGEAFLQLWKGIAQLKQESKILPDYLCSLSKDEGVECEAGDDLGSEAAARYHFDPDAGMCRKFAYKGCQGNRNRFRTYLECANFCGEFKGAVASVKIVGGSGSEGRPVSGYILLTQADEDSPVYIRGEIRGLEAVPHGFHIHEFGNTDDGCAAAGPHFKPATRSHGDGGERPVGDWGNIFTPEVENHVTLIDIVDDVISLYDAEDNIVG